MSDDKMREEFEKWARPAGVALWPRPDDSNKYYCGAAQKAYEAWQASRASLCVELPADKHAHSTGYNAAINDCREAIQKTGVRVK